MLLNCGDSYCVNYTEGLTRTRWYTIAFYIPRLYAVAYCFYLHTYIAWYCIKQQQQNKSRAGENDVIERKGKHEMYEAAVGIARHTVLQQTFLNKQKNTLK